MTAKSLIKNNLPRQKLYFLFYSELSFKQRTLVKVLNKSKFSLNC